MNKILLVLAGALLLGSTVYLMTKSQPALRSSVNDSVIAQWKQFKAKYNKKFSDPDYEQYRMKVFASNLEVVNQDQTGTFAVTQFFDLTQQEFAATYLTLKTREVEQVVFSQESNEINVNWVTAGKVTAVKNQASCGSCWAFSTTGSVESALIIAGYADQSINLSEQQLVDCSTTNYGCDGGWMDNAFEYIETNPLTTNANYPYAAVDQACDTADIKGTLYSLNNFTDVVSGDVDGLKQALLQQPISVAVDASWWSFYGGGVFSLCGTNLNHGVLLVGFQDGAYLVKNSWGASWGENGFIRLADGNTCGIALAASYPSVVPPISSN